MPSTPEHITNDDSETNDSQAEAAEPITSTASQEKGKRRVFAAKTNGKAASSGGTKRTSDDVKKSVDVCQSTYGGGIMVPAGGIGN